MINKDFQKVLSSFPDDYEICIDNVFGWEPAEVHNMVDPHLYINTDIGQIEIEPADGYREIWHKFPDETPKNINDIKEKSKTYITIVDGGHDYKYPIANFWERDHWTYENKFISMWMEVPDWKNI